jgi:hypothetical protein
MALYTCVGTENLDEWLRSLGCVKISCPNDLVCFWQPPGGLARFSAPNAAFVHTVPRHQMNNLADIIHEIMTQAGLGQT